MVAEHGYNTYVRISSSLRGGGFMSTYHVGTKHTQQEFGFPNYSIDWLRNLGIV